MTALRFFLGHLRFSAACLAAGYPSRVPHLAGSGLLPYSCGGRLAWGWGCLGRCPDSPLGFLPCAGATPPSVSSPLGFFTLVGCVSMSVSSLLVYSWGWVGGVFATSLGFLPMCHALPQGLQLAQPSQLQATLGFFSFPGGVGWASAFPSFSELLLRLLAGVGGVLRPVSGCSSCGGLQVWSPCCPSLTLG